MSKTTVFSLQGTAFTRSTSSALVGCICVCVPLVSIYHYLCSNHAPSFKNSHELVRSRTLYGEPSLLDKISGAIIAVTEHEVRALVLICRCVCVYVRMYMGVDKCKRICVWSNLAAGHVDDVGREVQYEGRFGCGYFLGNCAHVHYKGVLGEVFAEETIFRE